MAWIKTIADGQADELLAKLYQSAVTRAGRVANILKLQSVHPAALEAGVNLYVELMHRPSPLTRAQREMIATVVSRENRCHY